MTEKKKVDARGYEVFAHTCPFTGQVTYSRHREIFEKVDPVPFAPAVPGAHRPSIRQRIENLLNRGVDPLYHYVNMPSDDGYDMEVPDDPEAPLTASEINYVDSIAAQLAEAAPLPDEGLPRPQEPSPASPGPLAKPSPGPAEPGSPATPSVPT